MEKKSSNIVWSSSEVIKTDREKLLKQKGLVMWFTGLSGSGKSTIAIEAEKRLIAEGKLAYRLDGDNIRHGLNGDLGFSVEDRNENIRRIAEVSNLFADAGIITLVTFIAPIREMRDFARKKAGNGNFAEVYVKASVDVCAKRDPKGLYKKAIAGEITNFTGISSPYEEPLKPELVLDTEILSVSACAEKVIEYINAF